MARKYSSGQVVITATDGAEDDIIYRLGNLKEDAADEGLVRIAEALATLRQEYTLKQLRISEVHEITIE